MITTSRILTIAAFVAAIVMAMALLRPPADRTREQAVELSAVPESDPVPRHYRPARVSQEARLDVDEIISRNRGLSKGQLKQSAELNELMNRFIALMKTPEMAAKVAERIAALPPGKGTGHGMIRIDFDLLDDARGRAWLEAAVSDDARLMEAWVLNTLDGAIFEFAFDPDMERTSNGVSLETISTEPQDVPEDAR